MFLRLRLCGIFAQVAILAAIAVYVSLEVHTFNSYCTAERGDLIRTGLSDPATWRLAIGWLIVTALPGLFARRSISLKLFTGIAASLALICVASLPTALGRPIECFTSGGSYPSNAFDVLAPLGCVFVSIVFYVILVVDLTQGAAPTADRSGNSNRH